jgi:trimeric autotransporter adhesin
VSKGLARTVKTTFMKIHLQRLLVGQVLLMFVLGCFALSAQAQTTCQQGCLSNHNTVLGSDALLNNTGIGNTATGSAALHDNLFGPQNTATGARALERNQTGKQNTACGYGALSKNTMGDDNIALGFGAGVSLTTGSHNIDIGNAAVAGESGTIRIGDSDSATTFIAGIRSVAVNGSPVVVGEGGQLGVTVSSRQFKDDIKPMEKASEAILALKPVTFRYKHDLDPVGILQFGLVAEEVEKVNADLVVRDEQGKPYSVRYEAVNAMLLNEFLKEHREVREQKATIVRMQRQIDSLTAGLEKVGARLELSKPALTTAVNNQ